MYAIAVLIVLLIIIVGGLMWLEKQDDYDNPDLWGT